MTTGIINTVDVQDSNNAAGTLHAAYLDSVINNNLQGDQLANFFHNWIQGIVGLPGQLIRPFWQAEPPNLPGAGINWMAFGIQSKVGDTFAVETPNSDTDLGSIVRHEVLNLITSFYGPDADSYASMLREGMSVTQNREPLDLFSMGLISCGQIVAMPELLKEKWVYRADLKFSIKRRILINYNIPTILTAAYSLDNEHFKTQINLAE